MKSIAEKPAQQLYHIFAVPVTMDFVMMMFMKLTKVYPKLAPCQNMSLLKNLNFMIAKSANELA